MLYIRPSTHEIRQISHIARKNNAARANKRNVTKTSRVLQRQTPAPLEKRRKKQTTQKESKKQVEKSGKEYRVVRYNNLCDNWY